MKRFIINGRIDDELVPRFIQYLESLNDTDKVLIYLCSQGGSETAATILIDIINSDPERFEIFALEKIFSAAFDLFFLSKCKRRLDSKTVGMCHLSYIQCEMMKLGLAYYDQDDAWLKGHPVRKGEMQAILDDLKVPIKKQREILKGKNVFFQPHELNSFLINQEGKSCLQEPAKEGIQVIPAGI